MKTVELSDEEYQVIARLLLEVSIPAILAPLMTDLQKKFPPIQNMSPLQKKVQN